MPLSSNKCPRASNLTRLVPSVSLDDVRKLVMYPLLTISLNLYIPRTTFTTVCLFLKVVFRHPYRKTLMIVWQVLSLYPIPGKYASLFSVFVAYSLIGRSTAIRTFMGPTLTISAQNDSKSVNTRATSSHTVKVIQRMYYVAFSL